MAGRGSRRTTAAARAAPHQKDAIGAARRHAKEHQPAQVIVHALDGHVRTAYTYGDTPAAAPGERGRKAGEHGGVF
ncbi:DUF2188 domain-containing protein [Streptomyces xanthophaeus]